MDLTHGSGSSLFHGFPRTIPHIYALDRQLPALVTHRSSHGLDAVSVLHLSQKLQRKLRAGPLIVSQLAAELASLALRHGSNKATRSLHLWLQPVKLQQPFPTFPHSLPPAARIAHLQKHPASSSASDPDKLWTSSTLCTSSCDSRESECPHSYSCQGICPNSAINFYHKEEHTAASCDFFVQNYVGLVSC